MACRACGATRAPRAEDPSLGICGNCYNQFRYSVGKHGPLDVDAFNAWLARRLYLDLRRYEQTGVIGRCEAVSEWKFDAEAKARGHQCGHRAIRLRDGRRVCALHASATAPRYATEAPIDGYDHMREIMTRLARIDPKLKQCMQLACEAA